MEKLIEDINRVSDEYYALSQELAEIAERKGTEWLEMKKKCATYDGKNVAAKYATNAEIDKQWDATADGRREAYLKIYLKGLQAKRGALILTWKADHGTL